MSEAIVMLARAVAFAADRHMTQRRKAAAHAPYFNHLAEVAELLAEATEGRDPELVALGYLHDSIEDTATDYDDLAERFGREVADLVVEVTDDERLSGKEKKRLQHEHTRGLSERARMLKIADKTSNLRGRTLGLKADYNPDLLADYVERAEHIVAQCRGLSETLERRFDTAAANARAAIASGARS